MSLIISVAGLSKNKNHNIRGTFLSDDGERPMRRICVIEREDRQAFPPPPSPDHPSVTLALRVSRILLSSRCFVCAPNRTKEKKGNKNKIYTPPPQPSSFWTSLSFSFQRPSTLHGHAGLSDYHGNTKDDDVDRCMTNVHSTPHLLNGTPLLISSYKSREMVYGVAFSKRFRLLRGPCTS